MMVIVPPFLPIIVRDVIISRDFNNYYTYNIGGVPFFHEFCSCYNHYRQQNFNFTHGCHARCRSNFIHAHYEMRYYCYPYPPPYRGAQPHRYSVAGSHHP